MQTSVYQILCLVLAVLILYGIKLMSSPQTAPRGNQLGALGMFSAILLVLFYNGILDQTLLWAAILLGGIIGYFLAVRVTMIQMPQMVALLNGLGGGASALVALVVIFETFTQMGLFSRFTGQLALVVGGVTLSGSLIAAAKLDRRISQQPVILKGHSLLNAAALAVLACLVAVGTIVYSPSLAAYNAVAVTLISLAFGVLFAIRVGGADMPITISLLNSCSGLAGSICGLTIADPLLVSIGAIVGASGIILTGIMCRSMNRPLLEVLNGSAVLIINCDDELCAESPQEEKQLGKHMQAESSCEKQRSQSAVDILKQAKKVIIVPGYGMALAQAQWQVRNLLDVLETQGKDVQFAIHPVAGRMPGHMNVLLAEVDIPYDQLQEMDDVNPEFKDTDVAVVIGACDVVNPAAITAEGTPIYGMPILRVDEARQVVVCNIDTKPGYSGVENPLYNQSSVHLLLGNAAETLEQLIDGLKS
jgi:NAD(P) transhydrogenase subunit beta